MDLPAPPDGPAVDSRTGHGPAAREGPAWPGISAVMPVLDEERHLADAVRRILDQDYPGELEVVLALGPSRDRTDEVAAELAASDPRVCLVPNPSGRTPDGLNAAIAASRHPVVARVDGHGLLGEGYLRTAVELLRATGAANVGGTMAAEGETPFEQAVALAMTSPLGVGPARFHTGGAEGPADTVYLGVFAREWLAAMGGYDPAYARAQDWELNHRIRGAGGTVWYSPRLTVAYRPRPDVPALARQYFHYGRWRRQLVRRHPGTVTWRYLAPPVVTAAVAGGGTLGLAGPVVGFRAARWGLLAPAGYAAGAVAAGLVLGRGQRPAVRVRLPLVLATMHLSWGTGFLTSRPGLADADPPDDMPDDMPDDLPGDLPADAPAASGAPRVAMLVKNSFEYDARVRKEATSLVRAGYAVTVLALQVPGVTARSERTPEGVEVLRVPRLYGRLARLAGASTTTPGAAAVQTLGRVEPEADTPVPAGGGMPAPAGAAPTGRGRPPSRGRAAAGLARRALPAAGPVLRAANTLVVDRRLGAAVRRLQPAVVHAHDLNTLAAGRRAARALGARLVYDAHELHRARNGMGPVARRWAAARERRLARAADVVVTATGTWADILARESGIPRPVVLRNVPERVAQVRPRDLRGAAGVPAGAPVLLYVGSVQRGRGIEEVLDALPLLPECHLVVVGYGAHLPALRQRAAAAGLAARVHFPGPVDNREVVDWSAGADVGTCLIARTSFSYYTSLPNKLFDYIQAGLPVLASDFPEMGAVVRATGAGEVCDPADPAAVAAAVRRILAEPAPYRERARAAAAQLVWEDEVQPLLAAYRRLALADGARVLR
jgi:succinoglycan biosynthesis protein ExoA